MKIRDSTFLARVHNLFFALPFLYPPPWTYCAFLWVLEKCMLLSHLLIDIFQGTPWEYFNSGLAIFDALSYFHTSEAAFMGFCIALFVLVNLFLGVVLYRLVREDRAGPFLSWTASLGFPFLRSVVVQLVVLVTVYLFAELLMNPDFVDHRQIAASMVERMSPTHIALCVISGLMMLEVLVLDLADILLSQEERLSLDCVRSWKLRVLDLASRITVISVSVLDTNGKYTTWSVAAMGLVFITKIGLWTWTPLTARDLPEYAYDSLALTLVVFNACYLIADVGKFYQYSLLLPVYVFMVCIIKMHLRPEVSDAEIKTEEDALNYMRLVTTMCRSEDHANMIGMYGLLKRHQQACVRQGCDCGVLTLDAISAHRSEPTKLNYTTYEAASEVPAKIKNSPKRRVLNILIGDIKHALIKSPSVSLALAELHYYMFANHYEALLQVQAVEAAETSIMYRQRTTNLRNVITAGISAKSEQQTRIMAALRFQAEYYSFMCCIEHSCECTVKFWELLQTDLPDSGVLSGLGQEIYETSQKLFLLVKSINRTNPDHLEFLLKFGLYAKHILHDRLSSAYAFQRIVWVSENATLCSQKDQLMCLMVSLEQHNLLAILDVNAELEYQLGYSREELMGFPATRIMHSCIAKQHHDLVLRFFRSMQGVCIGLERVHFLRHKEGYIIACKGTKKLVPDLSGGLKGVMTVYPDPAASTYTALRSDRARYRTGVMLCNKAGNVTEHSREADELGLHEEALNAGTTLQTVFPELKVPEVRELFSRPQGAVLMFNPANGNEESLQDEGCEKGRATTTKGNDSTLLWVRLVSEKCGDEEMTVVLFSPILKSAVHEYSPSKEFGRTVLERAEAFTRPDQNCCVDIRRPSRAEMAAEPASTPAEADEMTELMTDSHNSSVGTSQSQSHSFTAASQDVFYHDEMQQGDGGTSATPAIIKRLVVVLVAFFAVVIVLVGLETSQFFRESRDLRDRFQMIEYFNIRFELLIYMSGCPRNYIAYRGAPDPAGFVAYTVRARTRANKATYYNVLMKKTSDQFGFDYDQEPITINYGDDSSSVSFSYALLNYVNHIMVYTKLNDYYVSRSCIGNYTNAICLENNLALDYCILNGWATIMPHQTRISKKMIADLLELATVGRNSLYVMIAVCIAVVIFSSLLILLLLILVIRDKSNVMGIFAAVQTKEVEEILVQARGLNISEARFDHKQVVACEQQEDQFWRLFCRRARPARDLPSHVPAPQVEGKPANEANEAKEVDESKSEEEKGEEVKYAETLKERLELEETMRREARRELLRCIDSSLRNRTICKLGIVLFFFLIYGGSSLYFNYYVHDFNDSTTRFFFDLTKRNTYPTMLPSYIREAVRLRDKSLLRHSNNSDEMMFLDNMDELLQVEKRVKEYNNAHYGSRIFANYIALTKKLDSPLFCDCVDSYSVGQTGNCNTSYYGPAQQGLTAGVTYLAAYITEYAAKIMATNLANETIALQMDVDPGLLFPGSKVMIYLQSGLEQHLIQYRKDAVAFYEIIEKVLIAKAACFAAVFVVMYAIIFAGVLATLKQQIWITKGMVNMIPKFVIENNQEVQKLIYERRNVAVN